MENDKKNGSSETKRIGILVSEETKSNWEGFVDKTNNLSTISQLIRRAVNFYIEHNINLTYGENFSKLSHDLKEPLTTIKGFSQLIIENESDKLNPGIYKRIKEIYKQSLFLENKINNILNGTRKQEGPHYDVLIVEDHDPTIMVLSDFFKSKGISCLGVTTGAKGLEELYRSTPKVVLLDILLPDISGYEICKKIKSEKDIPVYYVTAVPESEVSKKIKETGADGFILKPFDFTEFNVLFDFL